MENDKALMTLAHALTQQRVRRVDVCNDAMYWGEGRFKMEGFEPVGDVSREKEVGVLGVCLWDRSFSRLLQHVRLSDATTFLRERRLEANFSEEMRLSMPLLCILLVLEVKMCCISYALNLTSLP